MSADELPVDPPPAPTLSDLVLELDAAMTALQHAAEAERDAWSNWERRQRVLTDAHARRREAVARYEAHKANPGQRPIDQRRTIET